MIQSVTATLSSTKIIKLQDDEAQNGSRKRYIKIEYTKLLMQAREL